MRLYPACVQDLGIRLAKEEEQRFLQRTMEANCKAFGTPIRIEGEVWTIAVTS